ncbi:response regulator transcription factor [Sphingomonas sp. MMS24-J45]|uniref:response regulator transcription factor n=1 Tax=Sphingomonas sp. MMS24-J45 TaxID=3238806 RepID=UPI00384C8404
MSTRSIYIVDDDEAVRAGMQALLSVKPNLLIFPYRSGDDFLAQLDDMQSGCVLLDYDMPGANGLDVLRELSAVSPKFGAIILTGRGATSVAVQAWKLGALDFLEKPCEPQVLLEVVENAFSKLEQDQHAAARVETAQQAIAKLTPREREVLAGLVAGSANKVIGYELDISPRTVEIHRANLMDKLGVRSLSEALRVAFAADFNLAD